MIADSITHVTTLYEHFLALTGDNPAAAATLVQATMLAGKAAPQSPTMTVEELASRLQISKQLAYKLCRRRLIKATNITPGAKRPTYRISVEAFNEYLNTAAGPAKPPSQPKFQHLKIRA
jgi:excisionase family DNA binding protein